MRTKNKKKIFVIQSVSKVHWLSKWQYLFRMSRCCLNCVVCLVLWWWWWWEVKST